jgi:PQQ-dependent dehydrogenase (methanol/ethanol family)
MSRSAWWRGLQPAATASAGVFFAAAAIAQSAYIEHCAACHGDNAEGTAQGPKLAGSRSVRSRSTAQLRSLIYQGATGMPAFHQLPAADLDALAAFVHSLNAPAAESPVQGSPEAGEDFFFGQGQCGECHMVGGRGKAIGPDLSNVAREMTLSEIRSVLRDPNGRITTGYELLSIETTDGRRLRGFARGRTNFDLQLQSLDGQFIFIAESQIASVTPEKSLMKPLDPSADLLAYLTQLTGAKPAPAAAESSGISFARIKNPRPGDWLTYNGALNGNRYSDLKQIDTANIARLRLKWIFPIDHFGLETTPLVADGVMYVTGPNQAIALDGSTGRQIWKYSRPRTPNLVGDAALGSNKGAAILGDRVFLATDDAHLLALNRTTGALVWEVYMPEEPMHYGSTVAPLPVGDAIIAGVSGGDRGMRGFLASYQASTGERLWRKWTIPLKGDPGAETWKGAEPLFGGGATWLTGAYDAESDTLYWPTGNPYPDTMDRDRQGDNLFSNCILALDPHTGAIKWHYQFTPHDVHDWDATEPPVLIDTEYRGKARKLLLHADRNGFFYVLDRISGELLLAKPFVQRLTWTPGIGPDGRPLPLVGKAPALDCPVDAANWDSAAYSPVTRLFYVMTLEQCRVARNWKAAEPKLDPAQRFLRAIDIDTGKIAWEIPMTGIALAKTWPGVMATAGGLVFYSDPNGAFAAADQRNGKTLWHFATNVSMKASPMAFLVDGKQFVAVAAGPNILCFGIE